MKTPNLEILRVLLNAKELNQYSEAVDFTQEINDLPPLNNYTTGTKPRQFLYDSENHLICWVSDTSIYPKDKGQDLLEKEPILDFMGIQVFPAN